jgi:hypothetical protein
VVWQGSAGNRRPYADLTGKPEITADDLSAVSPTYSLCGFPVDLDFAMRATKIRFLRVTKPATSRGLDNLRVVGQLEGIQIRKPSRPVNFQIAGHSGTRF